MIYYQIQSIINEAQLREVKWKLIPKGGKVLFCIAVIYALCFVVLSIMLKKYIDATIFFIVALFILLHIVLIRIEL